ncbi:MAG: hypothetical protein K2O54_05925, partial [Prevotella sp.]|nr:hypothetical protein [Prevotella sp.]
MNENNICKDWKELNTPYGKMYIEPWEWHKDNKYPYDDAYRITIYDSRGDWFDYFPLDYFYEANGPETTEEEAKEAYDGLVEMIELGAEMDSIEEFMGWFCICAWYIGKDKDKALNELKRNFRDADLEDWSYEDLEANEYVNHIGDYYIVIA